MDTKKLRQKILDLAIRGKLVPQDPNDEPASVLLERIRAEKEQLIKAGKIKRGKQTISDKPHYENVPFEIPDSWEWQTLGDIGQWQAGGTPNRSHKEYYGGNIPWLKTGDLNDGYITEIPEFITQEGFDNSSVKLNPKGSVLIALYGATIGKLGILTFPATTNQACCACVDYPAVDKLYLFYFLSFNRDNFIALGGGGAQPNISKEIITATLIPIPPLAEQKRIISEIGEWFKLVDKLEKEESNIIEILNRTKSKVLDLAIHGKLVPQEATDETAIALLKHINPQFVSCDTSHYPNLPNGWAVCKIQDIADIISGVSYNKADITQNGIRIIRGGNIQDGKIVDCLDDVYIDVKYKNESNTIHIGDIVMVASTGSQTLIGKTGYADKEYPNTQIGAFLRIIRAKEAQLAKFLDYIFRSEDFKMHIRKIASGTNINNIKNNYVLDYEVSIPPLSEIHRISSKIESVFYVLNSIIEHLQ